jgi:thiol-disulfide isomerase/thioredoxin
MIATHRALAAAILITAIGTIALQSAAQQGSGALIGQHGISAGEPGLGAGKPASAWKNTSWLNAEPVPSLESLRGRVVLLNFWVFTCYNCTNTVPALVEFDRRYRDHGLTLIGIHTPEFPPYAGEHDRGNLGRALALHGIAYPVAQDNDHATWDLYGIRYWPSFTLIDKKGRIRYEGYGEFHLGDATYALWQHRIEQLLAE